MEAARKLIKNHVAVLKDITNPSPSTQRELTRVPRADGEDVDRFLLELARRLLGSRAHGLPEARAADLLLKAPLDVANRKQCDTYSASARYLSRRIQSQPEQKKGSHATHEARFDPQCCYAGRAPLVGRVPDMSEAAAEAFKAVAFEVGEARPREKEGAEPSPSGNLADSRLDIGIVGGPKVAHAALLHPGGRRHTRHRQR